MFIRSLITGSRILRAPETDQGSEFDFDEIDQGQEPDPDEGLDDADLASLEGEDGLDRGESDDDGGDEGSEVGSTPAEVRPVSRAQARVEAALREAREAKEELARIREQNERSRQQEQYRESAAQREARLAAMDPYERQQYLADERAQATETRLAQLQFQIADTNDRTSYEGLCSRNKAYASVADDVEKELSRIRANGQNTDRKTIAEWLIGKRAVERAAAATTRQGKRGAANIARQTARPGSGRSDVPAEGGRRGQDTAAARRARLENMPL